MKKIFIIITLLVLALGASAQKGKIKTLTVDTLAGNNNATLATITSSGEYATLAIQVKIDRISTAAGGTLYLKSGLSSGGALVNNQSTHPALIVAPNDTLATTDVATQYWNIEIPNPGMYYYYIWGDGDANDTVKVTTSYMYK